MSIFSERMQLVMGEQGMTQARLCALTGIPKSAMTQYIHASFKPKQKRTDLICRALNVSPAWIMGLTDQRTAYGVVAVELSLEEDRIISAYRKHPELRAEFDRLAHSAEYTEVFRAAKSKDGKVAPSVKKMPDEWVRKLTSTPETDEDL